MLIHLEYIWLDGSYPQKVRSKTKIINKDVDIEDLYLRYKEKLSGKTDILTYQGIIPIWNFDGSSTSQANTNNSDLLLVPVNVFKDPFKMDGLIVLAEVFNTDMTPHSTNKRAELRDSVEKLDQSMMWGFEQEYILYDNQYKRPLGWPTDSSAFPKPQGDYYCGVGSNVAGRSFVNEHTQVCEMAGLEVSGINAEVMLGQWEYQIGPVYTLDGSDQLWLSRYFLERVAENYNYSIVLHPKPILGNDWNGSGMHINFSTKAMREDMINKKALVIEACEKLSKVINEHIEVYGTDNHLRLTGQNETCSINEFRYGIGDRTASIRIPTSIEDSSTPGYLEDRRPSSNVDPYEACSRIIKTICTESNSSKHEPLDIEKEAWLSK